MTSFAAAALAAIALLLVAAAVAADDRGDVVRRAGGPTPALPAGAASRQRPPTPALAALSGALGLVVGTTLAGVAAGFGIGMLSAGLPLWLERRWAARTRGLIEGQLIDAVPAIASAVRAGRSLVQALAHAGREVGDPVGELLRTASDRVGLGVPIDDALDDLAARVGGADVRLVTGVLRLHRRTGGALGASLDDLARTLRSRRDGARELRSLTSQARLSATILGLLPLGFFLFLSVVARRDVEAAYRTPAGASAIAIGLALQGAAFVWIRRLLRVEER